MSYNVRHLRPVTGLGEEVDYLEELATVAGQWVRCAPLIERHLRGRGATAAAEAVAVVAAACQDLSAASLAPASEQPRPVSIL